MFVVVYFIYMLKIKFEWRVQFHRIYLSTKVNNNTKSGKNKLLLLQKLFSSCGIQTHYKYVFP